MELKCENISFRYESSSPMVLDNVNFSVKSGERVGLLAPSGFGKSTLAMILAGFYQPDKGTVTLDGKPLPKKGFCPVQIIYQHPEKAINPRWHLYQTLEESGSLNGEMLKAFGIEQAWLNRYPRELSGGELQRFCVARALAPQTEFLICDEISTMLDVITQAQIWNEIIHITEKRNMGLVAITHNPNLAHRICTKIYDLSKREYIPVSEDTL